MQRTRLPIFSVCGLVLGVVGAFYLLLMVCLLVSETSMSGPRTTARPRQGQDTYLSLTRHRKRIRRGIEQELRLDAIQEMICRRERRKGGGIIGNLSAARSDCHDGFRKRLAECFNEMTQEFQPHLEAAARQLRATRRPDPSELARYIVTVIEGAIMQARTLGDAKLLARQFAVLKEHLTKTLDG